MTEIFLHAFLKVLLYPSPFAPKPQEDVSTKRKSVSYRLPCADQDVSIFRGQCQGAPSVASTDTLGRWYLAPLRGEAVQTSPAVSGEHVTDSEKATC